MKQIPVVYADIRITRRKFYHVIVTPSRNPAFYSRTWEGVLRWLDAEEQTEYLLRAGDETWLVRHERRPDLDEVDLWQR